jgi:type IV pilus assembly protein PilP
VKRKAKRKQNPQKNLERPRSDMIWVSFLFLFLILSCSEGTAPVSVAPKGPSPSVQKKAEAAKTEDKKEPEKEESYTYNPSGKPDPFKSFLQFTSVQSRSVPLTPLQKYEFSQIKLVAILLTPEGNIGLVEDATGKGFFVTRGTLIGKNDGKVAKILDDRMLIEEVFLDALGQKKVNEVTLTLHKSEEGGEK